MTDDEFHDSVEQIMTYYKPRASSIVFHEGSLYIYEISKKGKTQLICALDLVCEGRPDLMVRYVLYFEDFKFGDYLHENHNITLYI